MRPWLRYMAAVLGISCTMIHLQIRAALPERYGVYLVNRGKRQYLSEDEAVEVDLCEESSVTLLQNDPMTKLLKVLVAIGVF